MATKPMSDKVRDLKQKAEACMSSGGFAEAMLHLTHAIQLDPQIVQLYMVRSQAFLKLQQLYYAHQDTKTMIQMKPRWSKAYMKKGEIEFEAGHYVDALESYRLALQCDTEGNEMQIAEAMKKTRANLHKQRSSDNQIPWVGAAIGLVVGMVIIAFDYVITLSKPFIRNPLFKLAVIFTTAAAFFFGSKLHRAYLKKTRASMLKPPIDLFDDGSDDFQLSDSRKSGHND